MRSLFIQFSGLIGVLTFANRLVAGGTAAAALWAAFGATLSIYIVLALGDLVVQRALDYVEPAPEEIAPATSDSDAAATAAETPSALAA